MAGGDGLLSKELLKNAWNSKSFDPFYNDDIDIEAIGKFNLITAFEVFEHVPNPNDLMIQLCNLLDTRGGIVFSTLFSDNLIIEGKKLDWAYASPRNGHISLFSKKSISFLAIKFNLNFQSFSTITHILYKDGFDLLPST